MLSEEEKRELIDDVKGQIADELKSETKGKVEEINQLIREKMSRIDDIETQMNRPLLHDLNDSRLAGSKENKAKEFNYEIKSAEDRAFFNTYLRKGQKFLMPDETKALLLGDDSAAGYLAPTGFTREIIKGLAEWSPIRENARVRPISEKSMEYPKRTGQFDAGWVSEIAERTETTGLTYGMETMTPHEMYALVKVSNQMLEDSAFSLQSELGMEFSERFGVLEGTAFINGDATGKPEGVLTNSDVEKLLSGASGALAVGTLIELPYKIKRAYRKNAKWYMNDVTLAALRQLKSGDHYIWARNYGQGALAEKEPDYLLGYPVVSCVDMPDVASGAYSILFGDMRRAYQITDRIRMSVQRLSEKYAEFGMVGFMARKRVDGQVVLPEALYIYEIT